MSFSFDCTENGVRMFRKVVNVKRNILSHALGFSPLCFPATKCCHLQSQAGSHLILPWLPVATSDGVQLTPQATLTLALWPWPTTLDIDLSDLDLQHLTLTYDLWPWPLTIVTLTLDNLSDTILKTGILTFLTLGPWPMTLTLYMVLNVRTKL